MSEETAVVNATKEAKAPIEKVQLTIKGVIGDLEAGLDRKQIAKKYGLNKANATKLFADPKLQHRKVIRPVEEQFVLIDDAPDLKPIIVNKKPVVAKVEGEAAASTDAAASTESAGTQTEAAAGTQTEAATQQAPAPAAEVGDAKGEW